MQIPQLSGLNAKEGDSQIGQNGRKKTSHGRTLGQCIKHQLDDAATNFFSIGNNLTPRELERLQARGMVIPEDRNPFVTARDSFLQHVHNASPFNWQNSISPREAQALKEKRHIELHSAA